MSNSAASGSACVSREQHSPSLTDTNNPSLLFLSIHFSLFCPTLSQSSPPSSSHCALILSLSPSISVALSCHLGIPPCSCNPCALRRVPAMQQQLFPPLLTLSYIISTQAQFACLLTYLFAALPHRPISASLFLS